VGDRVAVLGSPDAVNEGAVNGEYAVFGRPSGVFVRPFRHVRGVFKRFLFHDVPPWSVTKLGLCLQVHKSEFR
jgi:hypothetical protein